MYKFVCLSVLIASAFCAPQSVGTSAGVGASGSSGLLGSAAGGSSSGGGLLSSVPVVGGLTGGSSSGGGLLSSLPLVGGLTGSSSGGSGSSGLLGSLPLVGGLTGGSGAGGLLGGLPLVGNILGGATGGVGTIACVQPGVVTYLQSVKVALDQAALKQAIATAYGVDLSRVTVNVQANVNLGDLLGVGSTLSAIPVVAVCSAHLDSLGHVCQAATGVLTPVTGLLSPVTGLLGGGGASGACNLVTSGLPVGSVLNLLTGTLSGLLGGLQLPLLSGNTPVILAIVYNLNIYLAVIL